MLQKQGLLKPRNNEDENKNQSSNTTNNNEHTLSYSIMVERSLYFK
jgi:hypothetical protein